MFINCYHCFTFPIYSLSVSLFFSLSCSLLFSSPQTLSRFINNSPIVVAPVIVNFTASPFPGVSQGMPLNLTCEAVGGPTLNVTWTTPTVQRVGSVISVDSVTGDDAGGYRCEVTSEAGTANDSITVRGVCGGGEEWELCKG